jgi:effector-binding domain-containing protein
MGQTEHPVTPTAPPFCVFHDEEFKPADMDVEIAIPVPASFKASIPLQGGRALTGREMPRLDQAACVVHVGPFETISEAYTALGTWVAASGYEFAGPPREVYLQAPSETEPAITEIQMPVAKQG